MEDAFHPHCQVLRTNPHHKGISKTIIHLVYDRGSLFELVSDAKDLVLEFSYHCEVVPDSIFVPHEPYMFESLECSQMWEIESKDVHTKFVFDDVYK